jgi:hypothetical protein
LISSSDSSSKRKHTVGTILRQVSFSWLRTDISIGFSPQVREKTTTFDYSPSIRIVPIIVTIACILILKTTRRIIVVSFATFVRIPMRAAPIRDYLSSIVVIIAESIVLLESYLTLAHEADVDLI